MHQSWWYGWFPMLGRGMISRGRWLDFEGGANWARRRSYPLRTEQRHACPLLGKEGLGEV